MNAPASPTIEPTDHHEHHEHAGPPHCRPCGHHRHHRRHRRPTTLFGRLAYRSTRLVAALVFVAIWITFAALGIAAFVATWRWIFDVLG